jgi:hypothetical protein
MATKRRRHKTPGVARRKATTFRLEPRLQENLSLLGQVLKKPLNSLVNEAVASYLEKRSAEVESDLQRILDRIKASRRADPHFDSAIDALVDSEARLANVDPAEGRIRPKAGPAQTLIHRLLHA